jgi:hypothetical protein
MTLERAKPPPTYGTKTPLIHRTGGIMSLESRIESLKGRHQSLESRILDEDSRPRPDSEALVRLKVEKLRLKEEMERLRRET